MLAGAQGARSGGARPPRGAREGTRGIAAKIAAYGRLIRFSHTVFALPFAAIAFALAVAGRGGAPGGFPGWEPTAWMLVALVSARTAAMGFNRIVDRHFDAENPRTRGRELPAGVVSLRAAGALTGLAAALFLLAASQLGALCLALSPLVLLVLFGYSYTKRFTWGSHLVLGLALAMAPAGVWVAVTGSLGVLPWFLGLAVLSWVAGFDVLYSCQDEAFDRRAGLRSIPVRFGVPRALTLSAALHVATVLFLVLVAAAGRLGLPFGAGVLAVAAILVHEHRLVSADDLSRLDRAFFDMNGYVGVALLVATLADLALAPGSMR